MPCFIAWQALHVDHVCKQVQLAPATEAAAESALHGELFLGQRLLLAGAGGDSRGRCKQQPVPRCHPTATAPATLGLKDTEPTEPASPRHSLALTALCRGSSLCPLLCQPLPSEGPPGKQAVGRHSEEAAPSHSFSGSLPEPPTPLDSSPSAPFWCQNIRTECKVGFSVPCQFPALAAKQGAELTSVSCRKKPALPCTPWGCGSCLQGQHQAAVRTRSAPTAAKDTV